MIFWKACRINIVNCHQGTGNGEANALALANCLAPCDGEVYIDTLATKAQTFLTIVPNFSLFVWLLPLITIILYIYIRHDMNQSNIIWRTVAGNRIGPAALEMDHLALGTSDGLEVWPSLKGAL